MYKTQLYNNILIVIFFYFCNSLIIVLQIPNVIPKCNITISFIISNY